MRAWDLLIDMGNNSHIAQKSKYAANYVGSLVERLGFDSDIYGDDYETALRDLTPSDMDRVQANIAYRRQLPVVAMEIRDEKMIGLAQQLHALLGERVLQLEQQAHLQPDQESAQIYEFLAPQPLETLSVARG